MAVKGLSDRVADLAMERVAMLLAERVADRVVEALMKAGFDKRFAEALLRAFKEEAEISNVKPHPPLSPFPWEGKGEEIKRGASAPLGRLSFIQGELGCGISTHYT